MKLSEAQEKTSESKGKNPQSLNRTGNCVLIRDGHIIHREASTQKSITGSGAKSALDK